MDVNTLQYQAGLASFVTDRNVEGLTHEGDVPCAVETQRQLGSRLRNHL